VTSTNDLWYVEFERVVIMRIGHPLLFSADGNRDRGPFRNHIDAEVA